MTTLRVHCWRNEYLAAPGAAAQDLDRLSGRLAEAFADGVDGLSGMDEDGVVLLRELRIDCDVDPGCAPDRVVGHWARALTGALAQALDEGRGLRLPSLAAYHARFIGDLLHARAWDSWMYRGLAGLRMLPFGAVVRTLLTADGARGRATLAQVAPVAWPLLFDALPAHEAARILLHWSLEDSPGTVGAGATLARWARSAPALPGRLAPALAALWLLGAWERDGMAGLAPGGACWLAALLALPPGTGAHQLRRIARRADLDALRGTGAARDDPDWLLALATAPLAWRTAAAQAATLLRAGPAAAAPDVDEAVAAPCAGLAWLLPALRDMLRALLLQLPPAALPPAPSGCAPHDLAALCALTLAAGPNGERVWHDRFWRAFLRVPARLEFEQLAEWLAGCDPALFDTRLVAALRAQALGPAVRLHGPDGADILLERGSGCPLGWAGGLGASEVAVDFAERLGLARLRRRDRAWLAMSPCHEALPPDWRAPFATLALAALRRTANRIPGLARSSLPYLFANVLGVAGEARRSPGAAGEAWLLEHARAPLQVLLSLTGLARLRLDWPGERSLHVLGAD